MLDGALSLFEHVFGPIPFDLLDRFEDPFDILFGCLSGLFASTFFDASLFDGLLAHFLTKCFVSFRPPVVTLGECVRIDVALSQRSGDPLTVSDDLIPSSVDKKAGDAFFHNGRSSRTVTHSEYPSWRNSPSVS